MPGQLDNEDDGLFFDFHRHTAVFARASEVPVVNGNECVAQRPTG
jgi:hypothetical protein